MFALNKRKKGKEKKTQTNRLDINFFVSLPILEKQERTIRDAQKDTGRTLGQILEE